LHYIKITSEFNSNVITRLLWRLQKVRVRIRVIRMRTCTPMVTCDTMALPK
jgi:hypothetical protein